MRKNTHHAMRHKAIALAACGALTLTLGASTAFATGEGNHPANPTDTLFLRTSAATGTGDIAPGVLQTVNLAVRQNEDGTAEYSTDGGQTWSTTPPEGMDVLIDDEGRVMMTKGDFAMSDLDEMPKFGGGIQVRKRDGGAAEYSTDGETWSTTPPEGFDLPTDEAGAVMFEGRTLPAPDGTRGGAIMVRDIDGVVSYSTDGETWRTTPPEGAAITPDGNGDMIYGKTDAMPALPMPDGMPDGGERLMIRCENGAFRHSYDGETWIDGLPEGMENLDAPGAPALPTLSVKKL